MTVKVIHEVFEHSEAEHAARLVMIAIADHAADDGVAWPDQETIARKTRMGVSTVREVLRWLEQVGEIETRKAQRGRARINVYRVLVGRIASVAVDYDRLPFELNRPFGPPPESGGGHGEALGSGSTSGLAAHPHGLPPDSSGGQAVEGAGDDRQDPARRPPE